MRKTVLFVTACAVLAIVSSAGAQGFGVYEQGACAIGRGGAAVAGPCGDGSAIFFNPAAIAFTSGTQISIGASIINPRGNFTNDSTAMGTLQDRYYTVPSIYAVRSFGKASFGVGVFAPYGLTTDWPRNFEGRFLGYKTSLAGMYIQPTVAIKLNDKFSIGGGVDIIHASLELNQRVDLSSQVVAPGVTFANIGVPVGTDFADVQLSGSALQLGYHLGMLWKGSDKVSIGARYLSRARLDVRSGRFKTSQILTGLRTQVPLSAQLPAGTRIDDMVSPQFASPNALFSGQYADTGITFPDSFVAGIALTLVPKTTIFADYHYTHWSLFDQIVITKQFPTATPGANVITMVENYRDTHGFRVGLEREVNEKLTVRAGFVANGAAAPDDTVTPLLPEGSRLQFSGGAGFKLSERVRADFYYLYLYQADRRGRTVAGTAANNNGTYAFKSNLFGLSLSAGF